MDMMGYGTTVRVCCKESKTQLMSAQDAPPFTLKHYSYRQAADDIAELARQIGVSSIILGGHDWHDSPPKGEYFN